MCRYLQFDWVVTGYLSTFTTVDTMKTLGAVCQGRATFGCLAAKHQRCKGSLGHGGISQVGRVQLRGREERLEAGNSGRVRPVVGSSRLFGPPLTCLL